MANSIVANLQVSALGLSIVQVIHSISTVIEHMLDNSAAGLVFLTLRLVYYRDLQSIPSELEFFRTVLFNMLGSAITSQILTYAIRNAKKRNLRTSLIKNSQQTLH